MKISELGTILGIWAHPDDEAYLSGALMATARDAGSRVVCVTATRGEHGTGDPQRWPPDRLASVRTTELARCLAILGVTEHHWLGYPDGGCPAVPAADAADRLAAIIDGVRPDTVLTFGPDGITGHADHRTVSGWATAAFDRAAGRGARLMYAAVPERHAQRWSELNEKLDVYLPGYPVTVPDDRLALALAPDRQIRDRKIRALAAQETQTTGLIEALGLAEYTAWAAEEAFVDR